MNIKRLFFFVSSLVAYVFALGCAPATHNDSVPPQTASATYVEQGEASYYDLPGNKTASGEMYSSTKRTAAHPHLAFGTLILVENLDNNRAVIAKVNDRGPFARNRILDLSLAAATSLKMINAGKANVRISYATKAEIDSADPLTGLVPTFLAMIKSKAKPRATRAIASEKIPIKK